MAGLKVSIIIPCYNHAEYLGEAIESSLAQTYPHLEVIVVDDGSTDDTAAVAAAYPVRLIRTNNRGPSSARNTAIMNAGGEAILPLDADDTLHPDYLKHTVGPLAEDPGVGVVHTYAQILGSGEMMSDSAWEVSLQNLKAANQIYGISLIRTEALKACGGYSPLMVHGYEDWDLWIDLCKRGWKFRLVPLPLWFYRVRPGTRTEGADIHFDDNLRQMKINHPEVYG